ncbi:MAG: flagellar motor switch protein FliM [Lachnospiraceae bacterium]|nr:flagellar motor switch protein FliM [Lachnospiraceae bacterium]
MGEVLSQEEIDSLLSALSSGEVDMQDIQSKEEKSVKNYDFKRPTKFSKEQLRTLELIFEHYGRLLSTNLPAYLRKNVTVTVVTSETITFNEFTNSLSNPVILGIANFQPLKGNIIIDMGSEVGYAILDRMLGGQGRAIEKMRDFSEIELNILNRIMAVCTELLREPWKNVLDITPYIERIETNTQFAQIIAPNEMIALVTLSIKIGEVEGFLNMCLPFITIQDIVDNLNTKFWFTNKNNSNDEDQSVYIESMLRKVDVPVKAVLGKSSIPVKDFLGLQVGDVIKLGTRVDSEMDVYVDKIKKFSAVPGKERDKYAVRVTSIYREEGEE